MKNTTVTGTSRFVTTVDALQYYRAQGICDTMNEINQKIKAGEISLNKPKLQKGQTISIKSGRYFIVG